MGAGLAVTSCELRGGKGGGIVEYLEKKKKGGVQMMTFGKACCRRTKIGGCEYKRPVALAKSILPISLCVTFFCRLIPFSIFPFKRSTPPETLLSCREN